MPDITLFDYARSSACYRVRIALNLKGLAYKAVPIDLLGDAQKSDDYRARNPQGLVPMLEVDGTAISQSVAIVDYLDTLQSDPPLFPKDPADRARVLAMALGVACDIHPLNNLRVLRYLEGALGVAGEEKTGWYNHWVGEGFKALEAMAQSTAGRFLFGDSPTAADVFLVPQMFNARRFNVPIEAYPILIRVDAAASALEPFAAAHPERVGGA
jgi:maleylacetoacetate isomerase